jgi:hypothetical protein
LQQKKSSFPTWFEELFHKQDWRPIITLICPRHCNYILKFELCRSFCSINQWSCLLLGANEFSNLSILYKCNCTALFILLGSRNSLTRNSSSSQYDVQLAVC